MRLERVASQALLTGIVVGVSLAFIPVMLLLKLVEGVYVVCSISQACLAQVWSGAPLKELGEGLGQRKEDGVRR